MWRISLSNRSSSPNCIFFKIKKPFVTSHNSHVNIGITYIPIRSIWSDSRLNKLKTIADQDPNNPNAQAIFYEELVKTGNYSIAIDRFEKQPQLAPLSSRYSPEQKDLDKTNIQQNIACLKPYLDALFKDGKSDRVAQRLALSMSEKNLDSKNISKSKSNLIDKDYVLDFKTLSSKKKFDALSSNRNQAETNEPVRVVISEGWSWAKFIRQTSFRLISGLFIITAMSVLLEQQGILKSALSSGEPEPYLSNDQPITFSDIQGVDEAKEDLQEIVEFLKDPKKFISLGAKLPKGILLYGPPGTGKTYLARAVAGEAKVPFFQMSGSEFDEMYVGVGAKRVRGIRYISLYHPELFKAARKMAPCIVFIDEIDAIGSKRTTRDQSYMRQTLNQLLVELDGFTANESVIFIGATNTPEVLDKALVRPGRFDKEVNVPLPDVTGRANILKIHAKKIKLNSSVDLKTIARGTPGFSGADLANLINQSALKASKEGSNSVRLEDLEWSKEKIMMGSERKSAIINEETKKIIAYHEGGHALAALFTPGADPLHKVTVMPRGSALGLTWQLPEGDRTGFTKKELLAKLDVCMGGRVAEELLGGIEEVSTGALSDLSHATSIARSMVCKYGMNEKVGLMSFTDIEIEKLSPNLLSIIDVEVNILLNNSYQRVLSLLKTKRPELDRLANALVEYETLDLSQVKEAIQTDLPLKTF